MKKLFALVLSAVLMVSCLAGCSSGGKKSSGTNSKDSAIQLYIKYLTGEASKSEIKKMKPQYFWEISDESPEDIYEEMKEDPEYPMDMLKEYYGKNVKITYEIVEEESYSKDQLEEIRESIDTIAEHYEVSVSGKKLTAYCEMELEVTVKGSKNEDTMDASATIMQYGGSWYIMDYYMDNPYR